MLAPPPTGNPESTPASWLKMTINIMTALKQRQVYYTGQSLPPPFWEILCIGWCNSVADPGFPRRGGATPDFRVKTYYLAGFLAKTAWKWKKLDWKGPPWIRQGNLQSYFRTSIDKLKWISLNFSAPGELETDSMNVGKSNQLGKHGFGASCW